MDYDIDPTNTFKLLIMIPYLFFFLNKFLNIFT